MYRKFYLEEDLSLDESLLLHRGRLNFRQYIKGEKAKCGMKYFELCDSHGYVINIEIYGGENSYLPPSINLKTEILVQRLMERYLCKGNILFIGNHYNSIILSELLLKN